MLNKNQQWKSSVNSTFIRVYVAKYAAHLRPHFVYLPKKTVVYLPDERVAPLFKLSRYIPYCHQKARADYTNVDKQV